METNTNEEMGASFEQILLKIENHTDEIIVRLEPFFTSSMQELFKENIDDFDRIYAGNALLKEQLNIFKANVTENVTIYCDAYFKKIRHDLRNPINIIKGYLEVIIEDMSKNSKFFPYVKSIAEIHAIIDQILTLINEIKFNTSMESVESSKPQPPFTQHLMAHNVESPPEVKDVNEEFRLFKERFSILIVDDFDENCKLLTRYLNKIGYQNVQSANNGFQTLEMAKKHDLILLDIDMPVMSGIDVLGRLKEEIVSRKLMVIMISAADTLENIVECLKLGADDFLVKPFNQDILKVRIDSSVEKAWSKYLENIFRLHVEFERQRYETLLSSIFPPSIVNELKTTGYSHTRNYPNVAILFADLDNFTPFCDTHDLPEIVESLQEFTVMCENTAAKHNLQKIKTMGDCFIGVAGMLMDSENPILDCIKCSLDLIQQSQQSSLKWKLHIGINYGTVIGGVVGKRQYLFDVWGDVVNTAERIQAISEPNSIYLNKVAWQQVSDLCKGHSIGKIELKGKKPLEIYVFEHLLQK